LRYYDELPVYKIEVIEYECAKCGYKWINRINGIDGPRPSRCAKCKRWDWEEGRMDSDEKWLRNTLRRRIPENYRQPHFVSDDDPDKERKTLGWRFLNWTSPRPTIEELLRVLDPPPIDYVKEVGLEEFTDKTGNKKYRIRKRDRQYKDISDAEKRIKELEKQKRLELMQQIINSREK
jgi:hypothetical protein